MTSDYKICSRPDCSKCIPEDAPSNREYCSKKCRDQVRNAKQRRSADEPARARSRWQAEKARLAAVKAGQRSV